jgi:PAS domain S-box-containing protein
MAEKQSEERYRAIVENRTEMICCFLSDGTLTFVNEAYCRYFNKNREELIGHKFMPLILESDREKAFNNITFLTQDNPIFTHEHRVLAPNGEVCWHKWTNRAIFDDQNNLIEYQAVGWDITERKQAEEALRESEEKFKHLTEELSDVVLTITLDGNLSYVSPTVKEFGGYDPKEEVGNNIAKYFAKKSELIAALNLIEEISIEKKSSSIEFLFKPKNKEPFYVEVTGKPLIRKNRVLSIQCVMRDITERKQAEEVLRESENRYRTVSELTSDYAYAYAVDVNDKLSLEWVTGALQRITEYTREEVRSRGGWESLIYPDDLPIPMQQLKSLLANQPQTVEYRILTKSKKIKWIRDVAHPVWDEKEGRLKGIFGAAQDITEQKQANEALGSSEEKHRTVLEANPDPVVVYDTEGKVLYLNPAFTRVFGWSSKECVGKKMDVFVPDEAWPETKMMIDKVLAGEAFSGIETNRYTKDGNIISVSVSGAVYKDRHGNPVGSVVNLRDISEQKKLESQLQQAHKMEAIGTLAGGIAHDFNNLMMGMLGNVSLVLHDLEPSHPHYETLKKVDELIQSGSKLTKQLLGFARKGKYEVKPASINKIVKESSETFGRTRKEITIKHELTEELFAVEADEVQIQQVLLNLYINAADAMPGGGDLFLQTLNVTHAAMKNKPYETKPGNYVMIKVTDLGAGMNEKTLKRIFDPFFTTKEMGRGTGLGLASTYGIIKGHGGYIDVDSKKGHGTTFYIYLPASDEKITEAPPVVESFEKGIERILLVDDEEMVLDVGVKMLETVGYEVLGAKSGQEAIDIYKENKDKIDLIILDMIMPGMGGSEAFNKMKKINPDVNVLLFSGYSIEGRAQEILDRGCKGFIQKPFNLEELSQKIREILDKD